MEPLSAGLSPVAGQLGSGGSDDAPTGAATATGVRYQPLAICLAAVCGGVLMDHYAAPRPTGWWISAAVAVVLWCVLSRAGRDRWASSALCAALACVAGSWHHCRWSIFRSDELGLCARDEPTPACVEVVALGSPRRSAPTEPDPMRVVPGGSPAWFEVEVVAARDGRQWRRFSGRARLRITPSPEEDAAAGRSWENIRPGDRLRVFAQLEAVPKAKNPGQFDLARHRRAARVLSELTTDYGECVSLIAPGSPWNPRRRLDALRAAGRAQFDRYLPAPQAALAGAVLLGEREGIDRDLSEDFLKTGTVHLLAISGLHVGILVGAAMLALARLPLPRWLTMAALSAALVGYALLVDARPPVVRATVLATIACAGVALGRRGVSFNSLCAAGLVVIGLSPAELFQTGTQLSFLCVAVLIAGAHQLARRQDEDALDRLIARSRPWPLRAARWSGRWMCQMATMSARLWFFSLPLVAARFHVASLSALGLNPLLWLPMAAALWSGFLLLTLGALGGAIAWPCAAVCQSSLAVIEAAVIGAARVPCGCLWVPGPPDWWLWGFYGAAAAMAAVPRWRLPWRWRLALLAGWVGLGFVPALARQRSDALECDFLAMGHGCAVVIRLPSGRTMLYDAGRLTSPELAADTVSAALWSRGVRHLDAVVISHPDADHYNAVPRLLERFSVGAVYVPPTMFEEQSPALDALRRSIEKHGAPIGVAAMGRRFETPGMETIEVLHPPLAGVLGSDNANSVVLAVEAHGRRVLLSGDLEPPGLQDLLAEEPLDCDVLLAPHHGSRASNVPQLARWCSPEWVVVSGTRRWDPAPLEATYGALGARVLHTDRLGAVRVRADAAELSLAGRAER